MLVASDGMVEPGAGKMKANPHPPHSFLARPGDETGHELHPGTPWFPSANT